MPAYFIAELEILNPEVYAAYLRAAGPTVPQYGGRLLVRADQHEALEGDWHPQRLVIVEFATLAEAHAWWTSPEYEATKALRQQSTISRAIFVYRDTELALDHRHPLAEVLAVLQRETDYAHVPIRGLTTSEMALYLAQAARHELPQALVGAI